MKSRGVSDEGRLKGGHLHAARSLVRALVVFLLLLLTLVLLPNQLRQPRYHV